jgi:hypothetical protein
MLAIYGTDVKPRDSATEGERARPGTRYAQLNAKIGTDPADTVTSEVFRYHTRIMSDRGIPRPTPIAADRPVSDELIVQLRVRVQTRYYDRPEVIDAVARCIAIRAGAWG